jgi:mannonate dehydratase
MKIGLKLVNLYDEKRLTLCEQMGVDGASVWPPMFMREYQEKCVPSLSTLLEMRERFEAHHLMLTGFGIGTDCLRAQLGGLPGREREVERVCETIHVVGEAYKDLDAAHSPVIVLDQRLTYDLGEGDWAGAQRAPGRGGVLLHDWAAARQDVRDEPLGKVSLEQVWERLAYLYERIVPVAEEADIRLATHPDDPPMTVYRGVEQALNGFAGFKKLFEMFPNPYNGMLLCLGCMQEAGEDVVEVIRYLGQRKRIFYVHFRNVKGRVKNVDAPHYTEVYPDEGDYDTVAAIKALWEVGYDGIICPDHQFGFLGDDEWWTISQAWQVGYLRALMQATKP